ncbi:hypothetical protein MRB53_023550 [Persea americana]|uniref:Uncharacterized protein n=1 Tax=Persea americana TaxID=3435 RepID=A0ACC2LAV7_PERAE|nr:hypothetical protein MRB53_023550 [Persea americana]
MPSPSTGYYWCWIKKKEISYITIPYDQDLLKQSIFTLMIHEFCVDCGVIVCYLMKQLTHKQVIASKLPQSVVDAFRAEIVSKFLNDTRRSWSIENFHAGQQIANDDFEQ